MLHETILARSFSRSERRRLGCGAFLCCLLTILSVCIVLKPYLGHLLTLTLRLSPGNGYGLSVMREMSVIQNQEDTTVEADVGMKPEISCHILEPISDYCEMVGDVRVQGKPSTVLLASSQVEWANTSWKIRPYARKPDPLAMDPIREWSILPVVDSGPAIPQCTHNHSVPGILFSFGGYAGNNFHAFADVIVPLFLTSRQFNREVQFLVSNMVPWNIAKFRAIFAGLSHYEIIDIDKGDSVHCFPRVIVGLKFHKELILDASQPPHYSMRDFREFLWSSYSLKRTNAVNLTNPDHKRPQLLIVSRNRTRAFMNMPDIITVAENLGYKVTVSELSYNLTRTVQIVNSCDVMMGVHGAGLTNFLFLPENAVFIQIVPIGGLDWHAKVYFGNPARAMNMSYLEYNIKEEESSLINEFPRDHLVFKHPEEIKKYWFKFKSIYLEKQNVEVDVNRFRQTLVRALELLH